MCAYFAGLLDGEGSFSVLWYSKAASKKDRLYPRVSINLTCREPLELLAKHYGGNVNGPYQYGTRLPSFTWTAHALDVVGQICHDVYPYVVIKRAQASLVLRLCHDRLLGTDEEDTEIQIYEALKMLNANSSNPDAVSMRNNLAVVG